MFRNTAAETRPELLAVVMEAQGADDKFIGDLIFPVYPSETRVGDYLKLPKTEGALLAMEDGNALLRAPGTGYKRTGRTFVKDGYNCVDRGLEEPVDDVNAADIARFFDAEAASAKLCHRNVRMGYEKRIHDALFDADEWGTVNPAVNYTVANSLSTAGTPFDFIRDMKALKRMVGRRGEQPNTMVLNEPLWDLIQQSILVRVYFFGQNGGNGAVTPDLIAEALGLAQILIGKASYSTAKMGREVEDADLEYIWTSDYIWMGEVKGGAPEEGGAGRTFLWTGDSPELFTVETYRKEDIRSDVVRVRQDTDEKVINAAAGLLMVTNSDVQG